MKGLTGLRTTVSHPWLLWVLWLLIIIVGSFMSDLLFGAFSIGPPYAITAALGYPVFLLAIRQSWRRYGALSLAATILLALYLVFGFGLIEAYETDHIVTALLIAGLISGISFGLPTIIGLRSPRNTEASTLGTFARVSSWIILLLLVLVAGFPVIGGLLISAEESIQANAFREFCRRDLQAMPIDVMKQHVPARFIKSGPAEGDLEISSHGRGCIAFSSEGRVAVKMLMPRYGFSWMLSARKGAELKGAFEPGTLEKGLAAYERGDYTVALNLWRPLAEQGNALAQHNLGLIYEGGNGVSKDYTAAAMWYRKAAEQGNAGAQTNLGVLYANGRGVPRDNVQALMWFSLAAAQGEKVAAKNRDAISALMSDDEIALAERFMKLWLERHP